MKYGITIANNIEKLAKEKGTKKTKLGEVLGASSGSSAQWKYVKFDNFLKNLRNSKINLEDLDKIANFLGKNTEWFLKDDAESTVIPVDHYNSHIVPLLGKVSEARSNWNENDAQDWLAYPFDTKKNCKAFAFKVDNDHMSPNINYDDIIFVDPELPRDLNRKIVVARFKTQKQAFMGRFLVRADGQIELKCDNPLQSGFIGSTQDIEVIGVVKHKLSKI